MDQWINDLTRRVLEEWSWGKACHNGLEEEAGREELEIVNSQLSLESCRKGEQNDMVIGWISGASKMGEIGLV